MTPEEATQIADELLIAHTGKDLTDIQRMILEESVRGKGYNDMKGYTPQYIKNEGNKLWNLLSEVLGEEVKKTDFQGALEKRLKSPDETVKVLKPLTLLTYNEKTWVERESLNRESLNIDELLKKLQGQTRLTWLIGLAGIGKTSFGECLVSKAWESDRSLEHVSIEILDVEKSFASFASDLLERMGDRDETQKTSRDLISRILQKLQSSPYWIQIDALERLIKPEESKPHKPDKATESIDADWVTFFQRCLTIPNFPSRLVVTSQGLPTELAKLRERYPNVSEVITLKGLSVDNENEVTELFRKYGVTLDKKNSSYLERIGEIYEGHPLVLRVIAIEIQTSPFNGNVETYWQRYGNEFEEVARKLQTEKDKPVIYNRQLQKQVYQRIQDSLERLPLDAQNLLCYSSVYRCPVPEIFWLSIVEDLIPDREARKEAYGVLKDRGLVEESGIYQNQALIHQHSLIRSVAYNLLKKKTEDWKKAERKAAELWMGKYKPDSNAHPREKIRGYLQAVYHYCEVEDWENAIDILFHTKVDENSGRNLCSQLDVLGCYKEEINLCDVLLFNPEKTLSSDGNLKFQCLVGIGNGNFSLDNYQEALESYRKAIEIAKETENESNALTSIFGNMGLLYYNLGQYKEAIDYLEKSVKLAKNNIEDKNNALQNLASICSNLERYDEAIAYFTQSLEDNNDQGKATAYINLALVYSKLGETKKARDSCKEALKLANHLNEANIFRDIGRFYSSKGDYDIAIQYLNRSLDIDNKRTSNYDEGYGYTLICLGDVYKQKKDYELALSSYEQSLEIATDIGSDRNKSITLLKIGELHKEQGNEGESLKFNREALNILQKIGDQVNKAKALRNLGQTDAELIEKEASRNQLEAAKSFHKEAEEHYDQAMEIAERLGFTVLADDINILKWRLPFTD